MKHFLHKQLVLIIYLEIVKPALNTCTIFFSFVLRSWVWKGFHWSKINHWGMNLNSAPCPDTNVNVLTELGLEFQENTPWSKFKVIVSLSEDILKLRHVGTRPNNTYVLMCSCLASIPPQGQTFFRRHFEEKKCSSEGSIFRKQFWIIKWSFLTWTCFPSFLVPEYYLASTSFLAPCLAVATRASKQLVMLLCPVIRISLCLSSGKCH